MKTALIENTVIKTGKIAFDILADDLRYPIYFDLPKNVEPKYSELAAAIATMIGKRYQEVSFDFPIDLEVKKRISEWTGAKVYCDGEERYFSSIEKETDKKKTALLFSGGFDSLAAKYLLPEETLLLSANYLGPYKREVDFFSRFDTNIITTNFRRYGFNLNSESFMGAPACLVKSAFNLEHIVVGDIYESLYYCSETDDRTEPLSIIGYKPLNFIYGLTEIGTAMVVAHYAPKMIDSSLASLSDPGREKYTRKINILNAIEGRYGFGIDKHEPLKSNVKIVFSKDAFYSDFLALYEIKHLGLTAAELRTKDIPNDAIELANNLSLDFYEKMNPNCFPDDYDKKEKELIIKRMKDAGIDLYNAHDYNELEIVTDYLLKNTDSYDKYRELVLNGMRKTALSDYYLDQSVELIMETDLEASKNDQLIISDMLITINLSEKEYNSIIIIDKLKSGWYKLQIDNMEMDKGQVLSVCLYSDKTKALGFLKKIKGHSNKTFSFKMRDDYAELLGEELKLLIYSAKTTSNSDKDVDARINCWYKE